MVTNPGPVGQSSPPAVQGRAGTRPSPPESEERHDLILDSVRDYAIFTADPVGRIQTWAPGAQAVYGWAAAEVIGQDVAITFVPEDRESGVPAQERVRALREGHAPNVRWHLRKDGSRVFIQGSVRLMPEGDADAHRFLYVGQDVTERRQWDERQKVLVAELQHRTRNLMSVVLSVADKTSRASADLPDFQLRFRSRLEALARVQGLLSRLNEGGRVTFDDLVRTELSATDGGTGQVTLDGPLGVHLRSSAVQTLALALHELATNALKYGALGQPSARLAVTWRLEPSRVDSERWLHIDWRESGVEMQPPGSAPRGTGQGRDLIERALPYQLSARTSYTLGPDGVHCTIRLPVPAGPARGVGDD